MPIVLDIPRAVETQLLTQRVNVEHVAMSGQIHCLISGGDFFNEDESFNEFDYLAEVEDTGHVYAFLAKNYSSKYVTRVNRVNKSIFLRPIESITLEEDDYPSILNLEHESLPDFFFDNIDKLSTAFNIEYLKKKDSLDVPEETTREVFKNLSNHIAELDFEHSAVELIDSSNLKFTLLFPDKKLLMVTKSLNPSKVDLGNDDVIFSLFINRKLIASDVSEISAFKEGFKKYLAM